MLSAAARPLAEEAGGPAVVFGREYMPRFVGLDLCKHVLEVRIVDEGGAVTSRSQVHVSREAIRAFAESQLKPDDKVAVEATTNTWPVARLHLPWEHHQGG